MNFAPLRHRISVLRLAWRDRSGSAAIELALIAPILISLLLCICDVAPTMMVKFKVGNATNSVADLSSQFQQVQVSDVINIFASGADVMSPFSGTSLVLRVTNVGSDGKGRAFIYWSCGQGSLQPFPALQTVTSTQTSTPLSDLLDYQDANGTNTSFIMVESQYTYTPPVGFLLTTPQTMSVVAYSFPRTSSYVGPTTGDPNYVPTPPASARNVLGYDLGSGITCNLGY